MVESYLFQINNRIRSLEELKGRIKLTKEEEEAFKKVSKVYPFAITPHYLSLMERDEPNDPIRLMVIPKREELNPEVQRGGEEDPFKEEGDIPHMTHRYPDRLLIRVSNFCPVYCRYCMRKRIFKGKEGAISYKELKRILDYLKRREEVREVILSGGEPFVLSNQKLEFILREIRKIKHVEIIRFSTKMPALAPQRFFDQKLLEILEKYSPIYINTHFNHPREISEQSEEALEKLLRRGIPLNNQAVLLKGINDEPQVQLQLSRKLLKAKVRPYYLFFCDPIKGAMHFRTSLEKGLEILEFMRGKISGLGIPRYALDLPGGKGKVFLSPQNLIKKRGKDYYFKAFNGEVVKVSLQ